jgi:hypothetical protein
MSPRRNRPSRSRLRGRGPRRAEDPPGLDRERIQRGVDAVQAWRGEQWRVRHLSGAGTAKTYRCPGCDHEIRPGVPHLVVWPVESGRVVVGIGAHAERRHWHTSCWQARDRRGPIR